MSIASFLQTLILISSILSIILILLQQRGASLSSSSSELYLTRRGLEKSLFRTNIITVMIFLFSIVGLLVIPL